MFNDLTYPLQNSLELMKKLKTEEVELVRKNILEAGEVTEADLVGAMQSLLRIQFTYRSISSL